MLEKHPVSPRLLSKGRRKNGSTIYALKRCVVDLTSEILKNRLFSCDFSWEAPFDPRAQYGERFLCRFSLRKRSNIRNIASFRRGNRRRKIRRNACEGSNSDSRKQTENALANLRTRIVRYCLEFFSRTGSLIPSAYDYTTASGKKQRIKRPAVFFLDINRFGEYNIR